MNYKFSGGGGIIFICQQCNKCCRKIYRLYVDTKNLLVLVSVSWIQEAVIATVISTIAILYVTPLSQIIKHFRKRGIRIMIIRLLSKFREEMGLNVQSDASHQEVLYE